MKCEAQNSFLKGVLLFVLIISFTGLIMGGFWVFKSMAPRPLEVVDGKGTVITTQAEIKGGQAVFQKYGLMDYGTLLGDGSYLGPDYTAESLKVLIDGMHDFYANAQHGKKYEQLDDQQKLEIKDKVAKEVKVNRYDKSTQVLTLTDAQVYGLEQVRAYYDKIFTEGDGHGIGPGLIKEGDMPSTDRAWVSAGDQKQQISDFFFWSAWLSSTLRPGENITFTNNWPYYTDAGNSMSFSAIFWSAASVAILILFLGIILHVYNRYKLNMESACEDGKFPVFDLNTQSLTESQVKTGKYFLVVILLFLVQSGFGGLLAHYYIEPNSFYGMDWIAKIFPFNISKTYHLQLAIFWIATAWLGMGIYVSPLVGGKEPKRQGLLVDILFWALVVLVGGSTVGEWLGVNGKLGNSWFLLGHQGWEYLELGRIWQVVLAIGMVIWLFIVFRALRSALKKEQDKGGLVHLLFYSAIAVPFFYLFAFVIYPSSSFTFADYWRWWVIHLWVEGIFEAFAVIVIGFLMVKMKLVTQSSTVRALLFQLILLLGSGVIGIGHHYYFNGSAEIWMALGAVFSALEVIPLTLLIMEAYEQYKILKTGGAYFPYTATFRFLISTAVWNLLGAGVLGFFINLPGVSYFEHGQYLTVTHAHGALMGVYGMFAIAVLLYSLRNIVKPEAWNERLLRLSCWGLNIGLAGMILITLIPVGILQMKASFNDGYWASRAFEFYQEPLVKALLWLRIIPDAFFIAVGILPLVYVLIKSQFNLRKPSVNEGEEMEAKELSKIG